MIFREPIQFVAPLALILNKKLRTTPGQRTDDGTPLAEVMADVSRLARAVRLPARLENTADKGRLVLHTERHVITFYPTVHEDAFSIGWISPATLITEARVAANARLIGVPQCLTYEHIQHINTNVSAAQRFRRFTTWPMIRAALQAPPGAEDAREGHHDQYLDDVARVIRATRELELRKSQAAGVLNYRAVGTVREQRHSDRDVYRFDLVTGPTFTTGDTVEVDAEQPLRGSVVRITSRSITLRLRRADLASIPPQGTLRLAALTAVFRAQERAVQALRAKEALNPGLLRLLVDGEQVPFRPDGRVQPIEELDTAQRNVFQRALATRDQLLVLGPPGTGKTRVLTEIAAAAVARGEKVLLASQTNRAVDNILERLPSTVQAVRTGNEDSVDRDLRHLLPGVQAEQLQRDIHEKTALNAQTYAPFLADGEATTWVTALATGFEASIQAFTLLHSAEASFDLAGRDLLSRTQPGRPRTWVGRLAAALKRLSPEQALEQVVEQEPARTALLLADPTVRRTREQYLLARKTLAQAQVQCLRAAGAVERELALAVPDLVHDLVPLSASGSGRTEWTRYLGKVHELVLCACERARLLQDWQAQIDSSTQIQEREILRYADIVATTCTGAGNDKLEGLDFDLALIDEAGQIATPNLLVPLVRARRHVLVGDHQQLPPVVDEEVEELLTEDGRPDLATMLRRSTFEDLYQRYPIAESHRAMLTVQRRMPDVLASFISTHFYEGRLRSARPVGSDDPLFTSPLAFVSTSDQPPERRREKTVRGSENGRGNSYRNDLEAEIVIRLVRERQAQWPDRAVIVPYRGQQRQVTDALAKELGEATGGDVGTVDAFQGGERDLIIFSFTRSNPRGSIGFLKELRRLNVAMTRARCQLILVGDAAFLSTATDEPFRAFFLDLLAYLRSHGDLRTSSDVLRSGHR